MFKKSFLVLVLIISAVFSGCSGEKQIDRAALAETVTAGERGGQIFYTFYMLSSSDKTEFISVPAESFEEACLLAEKKYIPNISLSKLELFITEEKIMKKTLKNDIDYIARTSRLSPLMYVTLCDEELIGRFAGDKEIAKLTEEHIILLKNKSKDVCLNSLSIFNNFYSDRNGEFSVSYINSKDELKAEIIKITDKK